MGTELTDGLLMGEWAVQSLPRSRERGEAVLENIRRLKEAIGEAEQVFLSGADGQAKYALIFHHHANVVRPLLDGLGLSFTWGDPDTTYGEDARAYVTALLDLRDGRLGGLGGEEARRG